MGVGVKILDGQALHVLEHLVPQVPEGALGDIDHDAVPEETGQDAAGVKQGHPGDGLGQAGEVCRPAGLDRLDHGQDVFINEGLGKEGPLDHSQDTDHNAYHHKDQVGPVSPAHIAQHLPEGFHGVFQLGAGTAWAFSMRCVHVFHVFRH